jgi:linoleoyl-CoA desaturase
VQTTLEAPPASDDMLSIIASISPSAAEVRTARRRLHRKAVVIAAIAPVAYWYLVVAESGIALRIIAALALVVALTASATCIFHDGSHGAFSASRRVNRIAGYTGDLLGASSWVWRFKHNNLHHGNTNVVGVDADVDQSPFARLAPIQPWRPWHRYQHVYMWILYGFVTLRWFLIADFVNLKEHGVGTRPFPRRPRRRDVVMLALGKALHLHLAWALAVPLLFNPWWMVLVCYLAISWSVGILLATAFQLAHCTELAEFSGPDAPRRGTHFVEHQLRTTIDVRCNSELGRYSLQWLMGGLDFQIEHHLAPRLPHTVYPLVAERLNRECVRQRLQLRRHASPWRAIKAHGHWLRIMGARPMAASERGGA